MLLFCCAYSKYRLVYSGACATTLALAPAVTKKQRLLQETKGKERYSQMLTETHILERRNAHQNRALDPILVYHLRFDSRLHRLLGRNHSSISEGLELALFSHSWQFHLAPRLNSEVVLSYQSSDFVCER